MKRRNFLAAVGGIGAVATAVIAKKHEPILLKTELLSRSEMIKKHEWAEGCVDAFNILKKDKRELKKRGYTYGSIQAYDEWLKGMVITGKYKWMWAAHANRLKHGIFLLPNNQMLGGWK